MFYGVWGGSHMHWVAPTLLRSHYSLTSSPSHAPPTHVHMHERTPQLDRVSCGRAVAHPPPPAGWFPTGRAPASISPSTLAVHIPDRRSNYVSREGAPSRSSARCDGPQSAAPAECVVDVGRMWGAMGCSPQHLRNVLDVGRMWDAMLGRRPQHLRNVLDVGWHGVALGVRICGVALVCGIL